MCNVRSLVEVNAQTDSNHDTPLTIAAAAGNRDIVRELLKSKADIEHKDKKGTEITLFSTFNKTTRERPKSALYLRLKIVKGGDPLGFVKLQNMKKLMGTLGRLKRKFDRDF